MYRVPGVRGHASFATSPSRTHSPPRGASRSSSPASTKPTSRRSPPSAGSASICTVRRSAAGSGTVVGVTDAPLTEIVGRAELALPTMTDAVVAALRAEIDVYRDGGLVPLEDLRRSVGDNLRYILDALRD